MYWFRGTKGLSFKSYFTPTVGYCSILNWGFWSSGSIAYITRSLYLELVSEFSFRIYLMSKNYFLLRSDSCITYFGCPLSEACSLLFNIYSNCLTELFKNPSAPSCTIELDFVSASDMFVFVSSKLTMVFRSRSQSLTSPTVFVSFLCFSWAILASVLYF